MSYLISVVVLTYNSNFEDLKKTILSIIKQKNISFEIIVADDGSNKDYFDKIKEIFEEHSFVHYQLIKSEKNCGTCQNFYNALEKAKGEYVKPISPQDFLYDANTLCAWYNFMKINNIQVSFGNAIYYMKKDNFMHVFQKSSTQPTNKKLYELNNNNYYRVLIDNLVLNDCVLGATYLCNKDILKKYLKMIINKIRLCEDFAYRIMLFDDIKIILYDVPVIYYSYGTGVSSKKKNNGKSLLSDDEKAFKKIVAQLKYNDKRKMKIIKFLNKEYNNRFVNRIMSFFRFPIAIYLFLEAKFLKKIGKTKTCVNINYNFLNIIGENNIVN